LCTRRNGTREPGERIKPSKHMLAARS
jgi:hypothetical protein